MTSKVSLRTECDPKMPQESVCSVRDFGTNCVSRIASGGTCLQPSTSGICEVEAAPVKAQEVEIVVEAVL